VSEGSEKESSVTVTRTTPDENGYLRADANLGSVQDSGMTDATVVINGPRLRTSHDTVVAFLRQAGRAIRRVRLRLSDASGVTVEEKIWFNDSTDATALAEEVAHHLASASGRSDLEAVITVSDGG
jgi:hypothetical protein